MADTDQTTQKTAAAEAALSVTEIAPPLRAEIICLSLMRAVRSTSLSAACWNSDWWKELISASFTKDCSAKIVLQVDEARIALRRAGVIIFPLMVAIWILATFPQAPANATQPSIDYSFAGMIGHALAPLFAVIGFSWQMTVALIPGLAAREVVVAALGTVYAIGNANSAPAILASTLAGKWSLASGLSFLAWYIFAPQCLATLGVVKRETNAWRWPIIMALYMFALAYLASFATYQIAIALGG